METEQTALLLAAEHIAADAAKEADTAGQTPSSNLAEDHIANIPHHMQVYAANNAPPEIKIVLNMVGVCLMCWSNYLRVRVKKNLL